MTAHGGIEFGTTGTGFQFQFSVEREDFEKIAMRSSATRVVFESTFQTIQCVNKPRGASGSSTIKTSDFASFGTLLICNSGLTFVPLQVNFGGISPPV